MYPGGKNSPGVYHKLINQIPPHKTYIECFAGSAAILRYKKPAAISIVMDIDARSYADIASLEKAIPGVLCLNCDALDFLRQYQWQGGEFVYCDPPYLFETRSTGAAIYRHEFGEKAQHLELLSLLLTLPCEIMISGYPSSLYDETLLGWRRMSFTARTRRSNSIEVIWCNYPEPMALHDYRFLGEGYRDREKLKRKKARWSAKLRSMPTLERYAMLHALEELSTLAVSDESSPGTLSGNGDRVPGLASLAEKSDARSQDIQPGGIVEDDDEVLEP